MTACPWPDVGRGWRPLDFLRSASIGASVPPGPSGLCSVGAMSFPLHQRRTTHQDQHDQRKPSCPAAPPPNEGMARSTWPTRPSSPSAHQERLGEFASLRGRGRPANNHRSRPGGQRSAERRRRSVGRREANPLTLPGDAAGRATAACGSGADHGPNRAGESAQTLNLERLIHGSLVCAPGSVRRSGRYRVRDRSLDFPAQTEKIRCSMRRELRFVVSPTYCRGGGKSAVASLRPLPTARKTSEFPAKVPARRDSTGLRTSRDATVHAAAKGSKQRVPLDWRPNVRFAFRRGQSRSSLLERATSARRGSADWRRHWIRTVVRALSVRTNGLGGRPT